MNINTLDFEEWFEILQDILSDDGIRFTDVDSVKQVYEDGRDVLAVAADIKLVYEA